MSAPKLPLLVRKNIKDEFEAKKDDLAKRYREILGEDYKDSLGKMVYSAMDDCISVVKYGTNDGEDKALIDGFNEAVSERTITVVADPEFKGSYCGCRVTGGVFEIVFKPKGLGTNSYSACEYWKKAIDQASAQANPKGLPATAKAGIKAKFDDKKAEMEEKLSKHLGGEKLTIHADFADIWSKIVDAHQALPENKKKSLDINHLAVSLGSFTMMYFSSLEDKLKRELNGDELMIEGFFDEVSSKEAWFGLVAETESLKKSYSDTSIEDGKLWCKSKPTKFSINVDNGFEGLAKLL